MQAAIPTAVVRQPLNADAAGGTPPAAIQVARG